MNPQGDLRDAYLILVNAQNRIDANYVPQNLTNVADPRYDPPAQMVDVAATALKAMFIEMRANGITNVTVTSGYRSYQSQSWYFNHYTENEMAKNTSLTREQAEAIVVTYSNRPGTSEHQTGLCCDMHNLPSADQSFGNTEAGKWLAQNCWKFGFVVRYPAGKTDATLGVTYEPWHFRYVGRYRDPAVGIVTEPQIKKGIGTAESVRLRFLFWYGTGDAMGEKTAAVLCRWRPNLDKRR